MAATNYSTSEREPQYVAAANPQYVAAGLQARVR